MKNNQHLLTVEYACDSNGDHTAPLHECVDSKVQDFNTDMERKEFTLECTHVYNLNGVLTGAIVFKNENANPILNSIQEENIC